MISKILKYKRKWCAKNPWYSSLWGAKQRCTNKNNPGYKRYGGRGIKFLLTRKEIKSLWVKHKAKYMIKPTLDRIDNDGNYEYSNCRFIENKINGGRYNREKTHCPKGHKYNEINTRFKNNGWRDCKKCANLRWKIKKENRCKI